ncbi:MAG: phage integrase SAM-like domain-containing protein, partial [Ignavibacteriaceae bacterium]
MSTRTKFKSEALDFLSEFKDKIRQNKREILTPINLYQFVFNYLRYSEHINAWNTVTSQRSTFNKVKEYFGDIPLTDLNTNAITEYLHYRLRKVSVYVARRDMAYLSGGFRYAVAHN